METKTKFRRGFWCWKLMAILFNLWLAHMADISRLPYKYVCSQVLGQVWFESPGVQSRTQSPQALWSVVGCHEKLKGNWKKIIGYICFVTDCTVLPQKSCGNKIPVLSWRPTADQRAWRLWVWEWVGLDLEVASAIEIYPYNNSQPQAGWTVPFISI